MDRSTSIDWTGLHLALLRGGRLPFVAVFLINAFLIIRVPLAQSRPEAIPTVEATAGAETAGTHDPLPQTVPHLTLFNPAENGGEILLMVDGTEYELVPGDSRRLEGGGSWLVQFHRGGDFGYAEYELGPGDYYLEVGDQGWDLADESATP